MKIKMYYFRYANFSEKFANGFILFMSNLGIPIVSVYIIAFFLGLCGIGKYVNMDIMMVIVFISILLGIFFAIKFCVGFKGVTLYDSYMQITTQTLGFGKSKPKIKINYSDISSIFISAYNLRYDRRMARKNFIAGDLKNYVELTLKNGRQYCFTVDRQDDFVNEVNVRMEANKEIDYGEQDL